MEYFTLCVFAQKRGYAYDDDDDDDDDDGLIKQSCQYLEEIHKVET